MIITAGVIVAGIAVLYWAQSWGNVADQQYTQTVNTNSQAMQENIGFEYTTYNNGQLTLYIINSGTSNSMTIARLYIWNTANQLIPSSNVANLYSTSSGKVLPLNNVLQKGVEVNFNVTATLTSGNYYTIRIVTGSGRNFDEAFSY
jgi:hypothetical protein